LIDQEATWFEAEKDAQTIVASFVNGNDPVMKEVVELVCESTGVKAPKNSDEEAMAFLKGLYTLMRGNMKWEDAESGLIGGTFFYLRLKYGRDGLHDKAGTCVNTSIFFASAVEAAGLDAVIEFVPGHAFAGVRLPKSEKFVFVETTGCGGGTLETSADFDGRIDPQPTLGTLHVMPPGAES
jgi:hypothetical protein